MPTTPSAATTVRLPTDGIAWIFLDMGSTLVNEEPSVQAWRQRARTALAEHGVQLTDEQLAAAWHEVLQEPIRVSITRDLLARLAPESNLDRGASLWRHDREILYPCALSVVRALAQRFRLCVVANQQEGARDRLRQWGLLPYFSAFALSHEVGYGKPDRRIFEHALRQAECRPEEVLMMGDRPDNDIAPAKALGMATLRVRQGPWKVRGASSPAEEADAEVTDICNVPSVLDLSPTSI